MKTLEGSLAAALGPGAGTRAEAVGALGCRRLRGSGWWRLDGRRVLRRESGADLLRGRTWGARTERSWGRVSSPRCRDPGRGD